MNYPLGLELCPHAFDHKHEHLLVDVLEPHALARACACAPVRSQVQAGGIYVHVLRFFFFFFFFFFPRLGVRDWRVV